MERKKRFFDWLYAVTIVVSPVAITLALIVNLGFAGFLLPLLSFLSFSEKTVDVILVVVGSLAIYVEGIVASLYWLLFPYVLAQQKEYEKEELLSRKRKYFLETKIFLGSQNQENNIAFFYSLHLFGNCCLYIFSLPVNHRIDSISFSLYSFFFNGRITHFTLR